MGAEHIADRVATDLGDPTTSNGPLIAVEGSDTAGAIRSLAGLYAGKRWYARPVDDDYWFKYVGVGDARLSVRRSRMHGYLRGDMAIEDEVVVQWLDSGRARVDIGGDEVDMRLGDPLMFPIDRRFQVESEDWDQRLVHLDRAFVTEVASETHLLDRSLEFEQPDSLDPAVVADWRTAVVQAVHTRRHGTSSPLAWYEAQRNVARQLLRLFPVRAERLPEGGDTPSSRRIRLAVEFVHAHAEHAVAVAAIAAAAGMSVRGLQEAFQRTYGQTPMAYLRQVRLSRAHDELQVSDPETASVGAIARRWGFTHMGRFSASYAAQYGNYPRATLRR